MGSIIGGFIAQIKGSAFVAFLALCISGLYCLLSPLLLSASPWIFYPSLFVWGAAVVADSPQFSTLVARSAPMHLKGSALTIVNCIGFSITIVSIQLMNFVLPVIYQTLNRLNEYSC